MYIWVGADVDSQLQAVKAAAQSAEAIVGAAYSNFTLPLHISLKMSFPVEEKIADEVIGDLEALFGALAPFAVQVQGLEKWDTILWIRMRPSRVLNALHDQLNDFLAEKYSVGLHPYDRDYKFHTTLYMDDDEEKVAQAYQLVRNASIPQALHLNRFLIGASSSGALGTYRVLRAIER